jgi:hypothetical protein
MSSRFFRLLILGVGGALMVGLPVAAYGMTTRSASWHIVAVLRHCGGWDSLLSVAATGPRDAWALGVPQGGGPGCAGDLEHWDGSAWHRVAVPRGIALKVFFAPGTFSVPLAVSSASDAWMFPVRRSGLNVYSYALRWNGRAWQKSSVPGRLTVQSAEAFGPRDVWAFGLMSKGLTVQEPAAARYNGRRWQVMALPAYPVAVTASSPCALWVAGPARAAAGTASARRHLVAMHWSGTGWQVIALPELPVRRGITYEPAYVSAAAPDRLWLSYQVAEQGSDVRIGLLRWDGTRWHGIRVPAAISLVSGMFQDGEGGLWLLADVDENYSGVQYWYHYSAGRWTRQPVSSPRGYSATMFGLAGVPGTTSAWAVGEADDNNGSVGVIAKLGH